MRSRASKAGIAASDRVVREMWDIEFSWDPYLGMTTADEHSEWYIYSSYFRVESEAAYNNTQALNLNVVKRNLLRLSLNPFVSETQNSHME